MSGATARPNYELPASAPGSWCIFDTSEPEPPYGEFDSLSSYYPDLYHLFALSTVGLMSELDKIVDLTDKTVADVGAGTGRATLAAARKARAVIAVDPYRSVVAFGVQAVRDAGLTNVTYVSGHGASLPLADSSVDVLLYAWAPSFYREAYRVLKPAGYLCDMASSPGNICGELTALLRNQPAPPAEWFDLTCPDRDSVADASMWAGIRLLDGVHLHDFTYQADYGNVQGAATVLGRLWGPSATQYLTERNQSTLTWRLRIEYGQVTK